MVEIHIAGVHTQVSDRVKRHITEKLGGLDRFHLGMGKLHVTVHSAEKSRYRVDVDVHLADGKHVVAHDEQDTMLAAVDTVTDKCASQLRKIHEKRIDSHRHAVVRAT